MNLLRKYYDMKGNDFIGNKPDWAKKEPIELKDSIGGGILDEVKQKIVDKALEECSEPKFEGGVRINKDKRLGFIKGGLYTYSLASEKLKEKDEEISRLKEENDRLRGEVLIRRNLILSEPDGIVREAMIQNLALDI